VVTEALPLSVLTPIGPVIVPPLKGKYDVESKALLPKVLRVHSSAVPFDTIAWLAVVVLPVKSVYACLCPANETEVLPTFGVALNINEPSWCTL
jgi:hypothetical protein